MVTVDEERLIYHWYNRHQRIRKAFGLMWFVWLLGGTEIDFSIVLEAL